jgi:hypothetical protein
MREVVGLCEIGRKEEMGRGDQTDLAICPSCNKTVLICDRNSGSCVVGVYVEVAFGMRRGDEGDIASISVPMNSNLKSNRVLKQKELL